MRIAARAHQGQKRKESDLPYVTHPFMVAMKLAMHDYPDTVLATALVHDVLEDTAYGEETLQNELGEEILKLVQSITYDKTLSWEETRTKYIESVRVASEEVKAISVADKIHNAESLILGYKIQGKDIWKNFSRSKEKKMWFEREMLKMLKETWEHPLVNEYESLVRLMEKLD